MRRQSQNGSLSEVNGRWVAQWRDESGRPRKRTLGLVQEMTEKKARKAIVEPINAIRLGLPSALTFKTFAGKTYLPFYQRKWKQSTFDTKENRLQVHLLEEFGSRALKDLTRAELQDFLDRKAECLSHSVVAHLRWDLRQILEMAVSEGHLERNPAQLLFIPREAKQPDHRVMSFEEVQQCLEVLEPRERLIVGLAVLAGMRPGEIFALRCGRLRETYFEVRERVYKGQLDTPKTRHSIRHVVLPGDLLQAIRAWMDRLPSRGDADWVFPSESLTTPLSRDNVWLRHICPKLEPVGFGWANFQVFRRTYATLSYEEGADAKLVADQMGHTVDANQNVYTKSHHNQRKDLADRLAGRVGLRVIIGGVTAA